MNLLSIGLGLVALIVVISLAWRQASNRYALPIPAALRWFVELDNPFAKQNRASVIIEQLDLKPGMHVLDIGCGPGRLTIPLAERVGPEGNVVAVDMQQRMLDRVRTKAAARNLDHIRCVNVPMGEGRLGSVAADRAVLVAVLGEITNRTAAMQEIFAALKPGGVLSVTETIFDPHYQRRDVVLQLAQSVGFRPVAAFGGRGAYTLHLQKPVGS